MRHFIIVNENVWDNESLGDEYVKVSREALFRIRREGHLDSASHACHINCIVREGKKTRNATQMRRAAKSPKITFRILDLVKCYRKHGKMPYGLSLAYAMGKSFPDDTLKELEVIISNTREDAVNIIEDEYRKALQLPPRTI